MSNADEPDNTYTDRLNPPAPSFDNRLSETATEEVTVIVIVLLSVLFVITFIVYFRSRQHTGPNAGGARPRRTLVFAPDRHAAGFLRRPLDPSALESLPVAVFRGEEGGGGAGLDCAVCLSELVDGEEARLLPKCGHGFHVECIDTWFRSNSTCPLCRLPVGPTPSLQPLPRIPAVRKDTRPVEAAGSSEGSSSTAIEIPIPIPARGNVPSLSGRLPEEGLEARAALGGLGHARRILSCRECDIEQGVGVEKASLLVTNTNSSTSS